MIDRNNLSGRTRLPETEQTDTGVCWWSAAEPDHSRPIARFEPIGLEQMTNAALLDRVETKFVLHEQQLAPVLEALTEDYRVLEINDGRVNHYRTLYFDTPDFALYRRHQAGGRNRYKVRSRSYLESDMSFLEVKHKVSKDRTIKNRIRTVEFIEHLTSHSTSFLDAYLPPNSWQLEPKLINEYTRITLVGATTPERVTIDLNTQFQAGGQTMILPGVVVVEVKQPDSGRGSAFVQLIRRLNVRPTGFSKYCVGVAMIYPAIKHNRFKPNLIMISKLIQNGEYYV